MITTYTYENPAGGKDGVNMLTYEDGNLITKNYLPPDFPRLKDQISTTNVTWTTIHTFRIPTNTAFTLWADIMAKRTGGSAGTVGDAARFIVTAIYKNVAGVVTIVGGASPTNLDTRENVTAYDATFSISGTTVLITVKGVANTNIDWTLDLEINKV